MCLGLGLGLCLASLGVYFVEEHFTDQNALQKEWEIFTKIAAHLKKSLDANILHIGIIDYDSFLSPKKEY